MLSDLERKWSAERCLSDPARPEDLDHFENVNAVRLPEDLRAFYLTSNGTQTDGDAQLFEFCPLQKLEPWNRTDWNRYPTPPRGFGIDRLFIFCDYMISSWAYAINLAPNGGGEVTSCGWVDNKLLASCFTEFIELYLADHPRIYGYATGTKPKPWWRP